jgi:hypothetical protein
VGSVSTPDAEVIKKTSDKKKPVVPKPSPVKGAINMNSSSFLTAEV